MNIEKYWEDAVTRLTIEARTNAGISKKDTERALEYTRRLRNKYKGEQSLPMNIVNILIDLQSSLITSGDRHANELKNSDMAKLIYSTALELSSIARDMTD